MWERSSCGKHFRDARADLIVELGVITTNDAAKKLYRKFGFKAFGIIPRSLKRGDRYFDLELMRLDL